MPSIGGHSSPTRRSSCRTACPSPTSSTCTCMRADGHVARSSSSTAARRSRVACERVTSTTCRAPHASIQRNTWQPTPPSAPVTTYVRSACSLVL
eukprot:2482696-Prymnesium_polylepis.1